MKLTNQEERVYNLIVKEKCYKRQEIAERMGLTINAVSYHLGNIYSKLGLERNSITNLVYDYIERQKYGNEI